ncbi:polyribonucleotide nucleotidyltransferase [Patescibacteria group bacterium]|nr:polyribonucleotide nucleotidyltransferase [Patescibacteria group bacterium]
MQTKEYSLEIGGKKITAQFSDLANQTNGSVILSCEDTVVMVTAVMSDNKREGQDWFPLSVEFEEKFYAVGKILGSQFMRKEGMPSSNAVLNGRIVDRTIRPLFDSSIRNDIQVIASVLSLGKCSPDVLAVNGASLALGTSDIPWEGPVSAIRITANNNNELLVNLNSQIPLEGTKLDLMTCGKDGNLNMMEIRANQISNELGSQAFLKASEEIEKIQTWQKEIISEIGKEKRVIEKEELSAEALNYFKENFETRITTEIFGENGKKAINQIKDEWMKAFKENFEEENKSLALGLYEKITDDIIHQRALNEDMRVDGRAMDQIRALVAKAGVISPTAHGTGVFYRGGTHVFSALTLGGPKDTLMLNDIENEGTTKRYFHHYNFPPYSVGETGRVGGFNRRMIGHGMLAEKALLAVLPSEEEFPYTIRIVSEAMASNGSTSMASTCGSTIALMDAGVPIKAPVAGIAMGLMMGDENNYKILTDIQGPEDHYGDMDFKVTGTRNGITAIQMDVKVTGVPIKILSEALIQAEKARFQILDVIEAEIPKPRKDLAPNAPRILQMQIKPEQIGGVIGSGGKVINEIREKTGVEIDIEDDGRLFITGPATGIEEAQKTILELTREYTVGERFEGKIIKMFDFGAIVEIGAKTEGMVHISEVAPFRVEDINKVLKEGMIVPVVIKEMEKGKMKLSIKDADPQFIKKPEVPTTPQTTIEIKDLPKTE